MADATGLRDTLLAVAAQLADRAHRTRTDPARFAADLHGAWRGLVDGTPVAADADFSADPTTGVEALAFVVGDGGGAQGGIVLRLAGELPDSFEPVTGLRPLTTPDDVRDAFFPRQA
jgi:hypothetical protein